MGLTSSVPNSILQPGVCTSTTRPAAPYEGQAVYETDTNKTLIYNGTAWVIFNDPNAASVVTSDDISTIVKLTQAEYDALTPDANTLYVIVG